MDSRLQSALGLIRDVADFPSPGILFKDISPLLADGPALACVIEHMAAPWQGTARPDVIVCPEARGFIFGTALALHLGCGIVPVRKPGKLPWHTRRVDYALEYGSDALEIHTDALAPGQRVLLVDDVLATGGTLAACAGLVEGAGATVLGGAFLIELTALGGRARLGRMRVASLLALP